MSTSIQIPDPTTSTPCTEETKGNQKQDRFCFFILIAMLVVGVVLIVIFKGSSFGVTPTPTTTHSNRTTQLPTKISILETSKQRKTTEQTTSKSDDITGDNECKTEICQDAVLHLKSSMDESIKPCQDFYKYACQGWNDIYSPELKPRYETVTSVTEEMTRENLDKMTAVLEAKMNNEEQEILVGAEKKAIEFYTSCMKRNYQSLILDLTNAKLPWEAWDDPETTPKSRVCTTLVKDLMPEVAIKYFIEAEYTSAKNSSMVEIFNNILTSYKSAIKTVSWIKDSVSRNNITQALTQMTFEMGYNETLLNSAWAKIDDIYAAVPIYPTPYHFAMNVKQLYSAKIYRFEFHLSDSDELLIYLNQIMVSNAFYYPNKNQVIFTAGGLQLPLYHHRLPDVLNYAGAGWVVGHEISHGLYDYIIHDSIVTRSTRMSFLKQLDLVKKQYEKFPLTLTPDQADTKTKLKLNGTLTMDDDVADILGLQIAFKSYMENVGDSFKPLPGLENFTKEQIFFIASAQGWCKSYLHEEAKAEDLENQLESGDDHSPDEIRVLGSLSNLKEFSQAFQCPVGSIYNPRLKFSF